MAATMPSYVGDALRGELRLPAVPRVVRRAIELLREPGASMHLLAEELAQDPIMSSKVLRLANSPYYAGGRSVASIADAVTVVGTQSLYTLIIACGLKSVFVEVPSVHMRDFWLNAIVTAGAARSLARLSGADPEQAYLAGLLHRTGHLILCQAFPVQAAENFSASRMIHGERLARKERDSFGASHLEVSAHWCEGLRLPEAVGDAVQGYLTPEQTSPDSLASHVCIAARLAASVDAGDTVADAMAQADGNLLRFARIDIERFERDFAAQYADIRQLAVNAT